MFLIGNDERMMEKLGPTLSFALFAMWLSIGISPFVIADEQANLSDSANHPKRLTVPRDPNGNSDTISDLAFSCDGKILAVAYGKFVGLLQEPRPGQTTVWDVESGKQLTTLQSYQDGVSSVDFSTDGKWLATGSYDGTVQVWGLPCWQRQAHIKIAEGVATSLHFCPNSSVLAVGTWQGMKSTINLYQVATGQEIVNLYGHTDGLTSVRFSPDCKMLVSSAMDGTVRIWDIKRGTNQIIYETNAAWFHSVAFSLDGQLVAAGGGDLQPGKWRIRLWDTKSWKLKNAVSGIGQPLRSVKFSPDNTWLAAASSDGNGRLWKLSKKQPADLSQPARRIAFSPDGKIAALARRRVVTLFPIEELIEKK